MQVFSSFSVTLIIRSVALFILHGFWLSRSYGRLFLIRPTTSASILSIVCGCACALFNLLAWVIVDSASVVLQLSCCCLRILPSFWTLFCQIASNQPIRFLWLQPHAVDGMASPPQSPFRVASDASINPVYNPNRCDCGRFYPFSFGYGVASDVFRNSWSCYCGVAYSGCFLTHSGCFLVFPNCSNYIFTLRSQALSRQLSFVAC